ncbi:hypothetical protein BX600DRAFT_470443 [Xylariales sp. PMI_506]|nr:hypothetical protein BX600DRAFT_470443 [Xylariales sp. PMI_506]
MDRESQAHLTTLPYEVFLQVLQDVIEDQPSRYRCLRPLALTCKRLERLVRPLLWSHVTLRVSDNDNDDHSDDHGDGDEIFTESSPRDVDDNASRKPSVSSRLAPLLEAKDNNQDDPRVLCTRLSLTGGRKGELGFGDVVSVIRSFPNVKRLDLQSVASMRFHQIGKGIQEEIITEDDRVALPPEDGRSTASFTELYVTKFTLGSPTALQNFLEWPAALKIFVMDEHYLADYAQLLKRGLKRQRWNYGVLTNVLSRHQATLTELHIGDLGMSHKSKLDLNGYTALKKLKICYTGTPDPEAACDSWIAPSLTTLILECSSVDPQYKKMVYVDDGMHQWLAEFAEIMKERKQTGVHAVATFAELKVVTDLYPDWLGVDEDVLGPLQRSQEYINGLGGGFYMVLRGTDYQDGTLPAMI